MSSAFQVDHTVPLWRGGSDDISNTNACCASCHAIKTQLEAVQRADELEEAKRLEAERAVERHESELRTSVRREYVPTIEKRGVMACTACRKRYYEIFPHWCSKMEGEVKKRQEMRRRSGLADRIEKRGLKALMRLRKAQETQKEKDSPNPFARFALSIK